MAKHETAPKVAKDKADKKRQIKQPNAEPLHEQLPAWDEQSLLSTGLLFHPQIERHASQLSHASSAEQKSTMVLQLQQTYGNSYVQRLLKHMSIQAKLKVSQPDDPLEREANMVADKVTSTVEIPGNRKAEVEPKIEVLNRIFRSVIGTITVRTHLRKPNDSKDAPKKLPKSFNMLKGTLEPGAEIELLDTMSPPNAPVWQLAKHPETGEVGFVRLTKVLAPEATAHNSTEAKKSLKYNKSQVNFEAAAREIMEIVFPTGLWWAKKLGLRKVDEGALNKEAKKFLEDAWNTNPDKVIQLSELGDLGKNKQTNRKKWAKQNPVLVSTARGFLFGGLRLRDQGEVTGSQGKVPTSYNSLYEVARGCAAAMQNKSGFVKTFESNMSKLSDTGTYAGYGGQIGMAVAKVVGSVAGSESDFGKKSSSVGDTFGVLSGFLNMLKGPIDITRLFFTGIRDIYKRSKKGVKATTGEVVDWFGDLGKAIGVGIKGAFNTVYSVFNGIQTWATSLQYLAKALVGPVFGIIGAVINFVTTVIDVIKLAIRIVNDIQNQRKDQQLIEKLEDAKYKQTEKELPGMVENLMEKPRKVKMLKSNRPDIVDLGNILKQYEIKPGKKTGSAKQIYETARKYLLDRHLLIHLKKRLLGIKSHIPEWIFDGASAVNSIVGAFVTISMQVASLIAAPTGVGFAVFQAISTVSGIISTVIGIVISVVKVLHQWIPSIKRSMGQFGRNLGGWLGIKGLKTKSWQHETRVNETLGIMQMLADLTNYDPKDEKSKSVYDGVKLRLEATSVDLAGFYRKKGKPLEQAGLIYKALTKSG